MGQVSLEINGRPYTLACDSGEEEHVLELAEYVAKHVGELAQTVGQVGDSRLLLMAGLVVADELSEALKRIDELEGAMVALQNGESETAASITQTADTIANALDQAAERVEEIAERLDQA